MNFLEQKEWNAESSAVWKEILSRWGQETYDNLDTRKQHQEILKAEYDAQEYARLRKAEYNKLNQFEMQFDDQVNGTTTWVDAINEIKAKYPKE